MRIFAPTSGPEAEQVGSILRSIEMLPITDTLPVWSVPRNPHAAVWDWVPNSMLDPLKTLGADERRHFVPVDGEDLWETIVPLREEFAVSYIIGFLAPLTHLHVRLYRTVRMSRIAFLSFPLERSEAVAALLPKLSPCGLVLSQSSLSSVRAAIEDAGASDCVKYMQSVLGIGEQIAEVPAMPWPVLREVHLVPGLVVLYQCSHLARESSHALFHPSERYIWELNERITVTDVHGRFTRIQLPHAWHYHDAPQCECGARVHIKNI